MFEYKGNVSLSFDSYEENFPQLTKGIKILSEKINRYNNTSQFSQIINCNENYELVIVGNLNHENGFLNDLKMLLKFIQEKLPGSYGLIFFRNHENEDHDSFSILRLSKKGIELIKDSLLSPCSYFIEN